MKTSIEVANIYSDVILAFLLEDTIVHRKIAEIENDFKPINNTKVADYIRDNQFDSYKEINLQLISKFENNEIDHNIFKKSVEAMMSMVNDECRKLNNFTVDYLIEVAKRN